MDHRPVQLIKVKKQPPIQMTTQNAEILKIRDKRRSVGPSPVKRGRPHSLIKNNLTTKNYAISEAVQSEEKMYSLPPIHMKDPFASIQQQVHTSLNASVNKRQPKSTIRILQLIQKEMTLSKKKYFQTISSDRALIVRSKLQKKDAGVMFHRYQQNAQIPLLTPKLKEYPNSSYGRLPAIVKGREVILSARQTKWQELYSPWGIAQPQEIG